MVDSMVDNPLKEPQIKALTQAESEVLKLITEEFLTPKQIQLRRQCSRQAFYKILKNLKNKGAINTGLQKVDKTEGLVNQVNQQLIRLHGQEFNIRIIYQDQNYQRALSRSNIIYIEGHTIKLYRSSLEVYAGEGISFYGDNAQECFSKSLLYWKKFFTRLENQFKLILIKPNTQNVKLVNQHFARGDSEVYKNATEHKEKIKIFAKEDGKLAFLTDDSFGFMEDETVHPKTAKPDREEIDKQINDWRLHHPPTNSQLTQHITNVSQLLGVQTGNLNYHAENMKTHVEAIAKLGNAVEELTKLVRGLKNYGTKI